ncbi:MAG: acyl-CoA dehydrogenase [Acidimicrobiales bacterium]|nr:acyl-CoA dehydrogenase [Acidimicrobiales bacterium]
MTDSLIAPEDEAKLVEDAVADLLRDHPPAGMDPVEFRGHQYDAGLAWVHFPEGFGGLGVRPQLQRTVEMAIREAGAPSQDPSTFFMHLAGPTIVTHGTDEQRERFLRPMFTGEDTWCQLFSEPGAGSDFAGLGAKAVPDGDEWVVNGQKVWNTLAHLADWGMLVTRSNPELPKHKGMTYFAVDMHSDGVDVQPLRQITGEAEFNEVFLTDCRIPDANRIGDVGEGWRVSLTTLMNERTAIGGGSAPKAGSGPIAAAVANYQAIPEDQRSLADRDALMKLWTRSETLRLTNMRASQNRKAGNPGPEGSVAKLAMAELNQEIMSFAVDLEGMAGQIDYDYTFRRPESLSVDGASGGVHHAFLRVRANSIEGGTSEIMRNILGEQVLGLPGEPRVDKLVPWNEVPRS